MYKVNFDTERFMLTLCLLNALSDDEVEGRGSTSVSNLWWEAEKLQNIQFRLES